MAITNNVTGSYHEFAYSFDYEASNGTCITKNVMICDPSGKNLPGIFSGEANSPTNLKMHVENLVRSIVDDELKEKKR